MCLTVVTVLTCRRQKLSPIIGLVVMVNVNCELRKKKVMDVSRGQPCLTGLLIVKCCMKLVPLYFNPSLM